jgi:hypothetical protein
MSPAMIQALPYAIAALPLTLVCVLSVVWWEVLARPWLFFATGNLALYGLIALVVGALIFIGPGLSGYFLEVPLQSGERRPSVDPLVVTVTAGLVAFLVIGTAVLWALKQWLLRP